MKKKSVLIYGEFSGYGKSLVKGFRELGYNAEIFSFSGDGFKKISNGLTLDDGSKVRKLFSIIKLIPKILKYKNILIMNPAFFNIQLLGPLIFLLLKVTNKNVILLCCGDDVEFIKQGKSNNIPNWPYADIGLPQKNYYNRFIDIFTNYLVATFSNKLIPVMYDYHKAWSLSKFSSKLTKTIPLACDGEVKEIIKKDYNKEKIVIMHGINREDFKGTKIVREALSEIKKIHGDKIEILMPEKLPLCEYLKLMDTVDISIDQTKSNSYGMNAIYSMLSGHVVLAPANKLFRKDLNLDNCPIISINNKVESIVSALDDLINHNDIIYGLKKETQNYAIRIHDCKIIASKIDEFLS